MVLPCTQINVNLVRRDEDYTPPARPRHRAFAGTAHRLTDDAPGTSATAAPAPAPGSTAQVPWEGADRSLPTTSIQLRLADGSRMVAEFNLDHTVADIRRWGWGGQGGGAAPASRRQGPELAPVVHPRRPPRQHAPSPPNTHMHTHTLPHWFMRRFIRASRPDMPAAYRLATAFPPKTLDDDAATIEAAGLANSVVVQKL